MVLFWARTPCASIQPSMDKSIRVTEQNQHECIADIIKGRIDRNFLKNVFPIFFKLSIYTNT